MGPNSTLCLTSQPEFAQINTKPQEISLLSRI